MFGSEKCGRSWGHLVLERNHWFSVYEFVYYETETKKFLQKKDLGSHCAISTRSYFMGKDVYHWFVKLIIYQETLFQMDANWSPFVSAETTWNWSKTDFSVEAKNKHKVFQPFRFVGPAPWNYSKIYKLRDEAAWTCNMKKDPEITSFLQSGEIQKHDIDQYLQKE